MSQGPQVNIIDTVFLGQTSVIGLYLLESDDGLVLVETGPETVFERVQEAIGAKGYDWRDVRHVLLTHIHFDHAGGAWRFAEAGAKIYVHPRGLGHMQDPTRLWGSAERIYGSAMRSLWGSMEPIDEALLVAVDDGDRIEIGELKFDVFYTPGHAIHHNIYRLGDIIFTGDVGGIKIDGGPAVPPCPPPDIHIEAWKDSIQLLRELSPKRLYLAHFGKVENPQGHLDELESTLEAWSQWMKVHYEQKTPPDEIRPLFQAYVQEWLKGAGATDEVIARYEAGNPSFMAVAGLLRYWRLKEEGRL